MVALHGPGGIGKSTLAIRAAHAVTDRFPDGQLYVDLQGSSPGLEPLTTADVLGRFLRARAPEADLPTDEGELAARFRTELAGRRMLLLLDNAAGIKQLMPLLPASSSCAVLITSRQQLTTLPAVHIAAIPLDTAQAIELLVLLAGSDRVLAESDAAAEVARWCGYSPLALRIVGARLAGSPDLAISTLARRLRAGHWRDLEVDDMSVRSSFDVSYAELVEQDGTAHPDAARAFRLIGLLQVPELTPPVVAALLSAPVDEAEAILGQLRDLHLVESTGSAGRYRMHDLLRLYSRDLARQFDSQEDRDTAVRRAHEWYLAAIAEVSRVISGNRFNVDGIEVRVLALDSPADAVDWLDAELPNILALAGQGADLPGLLGGSLIRLVPMLANILQKRGRWHEAETLTTLAAETANQLGDGLAESGILASLSACDWRAGRLVEAEKNLQRSLVLRRATGDPVAESRALHNLGWLYQRAGRLPEAIENYELSLEVLAESGPAIWLGMALHNLGEAYFEAHDYLRAEDYLERALPIRRAENDASGRCLTLVALGRTYGQRGRYDEALAMLSEGVLCCREVGNREDEWVALLVRTEFLLRMGRPEEAEPVIGQVLAITRRLQNDYGEAAAQRQLAKALAALGRTEEAESASQRAKALFANRSSADDGLLEDFFTNPPTPPQ
nr:tetratricopeptide repeat protein [Kribbella qitaiheensis]